MSALTAAQPTREILDVAAVVAGGQELPLPLGSWQQAYAIAAMTALGCGQHHVARALCLTVRQAQYYAAKAGITLHASDQRHDEIALWLVCEAGARLRITHHGDRTEAVRRMASRRLDRAVIASRLCSRVNNIEKIAERGGIELPDSQRARNWAVEVLDRRYAQRKARRQQREQVAA